MVLFTTSVSYYLQRLDIFLLTSIYTNILKGVRKQENVPRGALPRNL